jgi:hypothetical protein
MATQKEEFIQYVILPEVGSEPALASSDCDLYNLKM